MIPTVGEIVGLAVGVTLVIVGLLVGRSIGTVGHELAHYLVARHYGLDPEIEVYWATRLGPIDGGRMWVCPFATVFDLERYPSTVSRRISFAPLVLALPAIGLWQLVGATSLGVVELPLLAVAVALGISALPSGADMVMADPDHRILLDVERQYALRRHADAEGLESPSAADVVETAVERRRSA